MKGMEVWKVRGPEVLLGPDVFSARKNIGPRSFSRLLVLPEENQNTKSFGHSLGLCTSDDFCDHGKVGGGRRSFLSMSRNGVGGKHKQKLEKANAGITASDIKKYISKEGEKGQSGKSFQKRPKA